MATRYRKGKRTGRKRSGRRRTLRRRGGVVGDPFNLKVVETSGALVDKLFGGGNQMNGVMYGNNVGDIGIRFGDLRISKKPTQNTKSS